MVRVKICGITNWADAKLAIEAGATALGFNFYPRSPRCVTPAQAWKMTRRMPEVVDRVGVFVNWSAEAVDALARAVGLTVVQLHGDESPAMVARLAEAYPVIKAFRIRPAFHLAQLGHYEDARWFLLDGFSWRVPGGTGKQFDWHVARQARRYGSIILAGGLTPANVAQAIREVEPFGVDVCSGVEAKPGKKDPALLRELMREVAGANRELGNHRNP